MALSSIQEACFSFLPVAPEPLVGGSWADALGLGGFPNREAFVDKAGHRDAPCLIGASRVLVAAHWSPPLVLKAKHSPALGFGASVNNVLNS